MPNVEDSMSRPPEGGGSNGRGLDNNNYNNNGDLPVDITRTRFSTLERTSSAIRDGNMAASRAWTKDERFGVGDAQGTYYTDDGGNSSPSEGGEDSDGADDDGDDQEQSSFDGVMHWLLTHLPNLQEEDAITYFHHLLEDGFDTVDILQELLDEDLYFMKKGHRRAKFEQKQ
jgi:hypothetical protein